MGEDDTVWPVARPVEEVSVLAWWTSERAAPKDRPPLLGGAWIVAHDTRGRSVTLGKVRRPTAVASRAEDRLGIRSWAETSRGT